MARRKNTAECYEVLLRISRKQAEERRKQEEKARRRAQADGAEGAPAPGAPPGPDDDGRVDGRAFPGARGAPSLLRPPRPMRPAPGAPARVFGESLVADHAGSVSQSSIVRRAGTRWIEHPSGARVWAGDASGLAIEPPGARSERTILAAVRDGSSGQGSAGHGAAGSESGRSTSAGSTGATRSVRAPWLEPDPETGFERGGSGDGEPESSERQFSDPRYSDPRYSDPRYSDSRYSAPSPRNVGPVDSRGEPEGEGRAWRRDSREDADERDGSARADRSRGDEGPERPSATAPWRRRTSESPEETDDARGSDDAGAPRAGERAVHDADEAAADGATAEGVLDLEARGGQRFGHPARKVRKTKKKSGGKKRPTPKGAGSFAGAGAGRLAGLVDEDPVEGGAAAAASNAASTSSPGTNPGAESGAFETSRGTAESTSPETREAARASAAMTPQRALELALKPIRWLVGSASTRLLERRVTLRLSTLVIVVLAEAILLGLFGFWIQSRPRSSSNPLYSRLFEEREAAERLAAESAMGRTGAGSEIARTVDSGSLGSLGVAGVADEPALLVRPAWGRADAPPRRTPPAIERLEPVDGSASGPAAGSDALARPAEGTDAASPEAAISEDAHWIRVRAMMDRKECVELLDHLASLRQSIEAAGGCAPDSLACKKIESAKTTRDGTDLYHVDIGPFASYRDSRAAEEQLRDRTSRAPHVFKGKPQYFRMAYSRKRG